MKTSVLLALAAAFICTSFAAETKQPKTLRVLYVTGGGYHDYESQEDILTKGLSERLNIHWTIVNNDAEATKELLKKPGWEKNLDAVIYNICFADETDAEYIENLTAVHAKGLPAIAIHCTLHSYHWKAKTDAWEKFLGVTSMKHGRKAPISVKVVNKNHPVMKGLPAEWKTPKGELYHIKKVWNSAIVLADGSIDSWQTKHPVIWTNTFGKARVFGTSMGHHNDTVQDKNFLDMISRGLLWVTGHLDSDGKADEAYLAGGR